MNITALVELDLTAWTWDAEVITAALASGTLQKLEISCDTTQHDILHVQAAQGLRSHACVLTRVEVRLLTLSQLLVPVLAHNSQVQTLEFCSINTSGDNAAANDNTHALLQALGRLTCLQRLHFEIQQPHDPAPALRHLTGLTKLAI